MYIYIFVLQYNIAYTIYIHTNTNEFCYMNWFDHCHYLTAPTWSRPTGPTEGKARRPWARTDPSECDI